MLRHPGHKGSELRRAPLREDPTKPDKVGAKVPKSVQRIFREAGISRAIRDALTCPNRAYIVGMRQGLRTQVVRHQSERVPQVELEPTILPTKLARREVASAATSGDALDKVETVRSQSRAEF
jgi:hypothetical protein